MTHKPALVIISEDELVTAYRYADYTVQVETGWYGKEISFYDQSHSFLRISGLDYGDGRLSGMFHWSPNQALPKDELVRIVLEEAEKLERLHFERFNTSPDTKAVLISEDEEERITNKNYATFENFDKILGHILTHQNYEIFHELLVGLRGARIGLTTFDKKWDYKHGSLQYTSERPQLDWFTNLFSKTSNHGGLLISEPVRYLLTEK